jgi:hypothetical protein
MSASQDVVSGEESTARTAAVPGFLGVRWGVFARELLPWLLLVAILAVLTRLAAAGLTNDDTYFHLRFGREFLHGWSLQHPGSVSTFATANWVPTQWLPEVVMAETQRIFGIAGVAWLSGLQQVVLVIVLYLTLRRWAEPLVVTGVMAAVLVSSVYFLSIRPQVVSFILVLVTVAAWCRTRDDGRIRWWLIPTTWAWAMVHGMWPVGIGLGCLAVVGLWLDGATTWKQTKRALLVPLLSLVAGGLTPVGPSLYRSVFAVGERSSYFSEWDSPDFRSYPSVTLSILFAVTVVLLLRRREQVRWFDALLILAAGACAVLSWRTVPVAAMTMAPLAARTIQQSWGGRTPAVGRGERRVLVGLAATALVALGVVVPHTVGSEPRSPQWVESELGALPQGTKVANAWEWGGYLMWRYPNLDLLMHGYGDTFTIGELQRNDDIESLAPGWDTELRKTDCRLAFLRATSNLAYALQHQDHWIVVRESSAVVLLRAPADW